MLRTVIARKMDGYWITRKLASMWTVICGIPASLAVLDVKLEDNGEAEIVLQLVLGYIVLV